MLTMEAITPYLPMSVYHSWANEQNQKTLLANKLMWKKLNEDNLRKFYIEMLNAGNVDGTADELPSYPIFIDISFLVYAYNIAWSKSVSAEIAQMTEPFPFKK